MAAAAGVPPSPYPLPPAGGEGRVRGAMRCHVTATSALSAATLTQSHSRDPNKRSKETAALNPARIIETYSAGIKLAQVARGEADIYLNTYKNFHDWDIA